MKGMSLLPTHAPIYPEHKAYLQCLWAVRNLSLVQLLFQRDVSQFDFRSCPTTKHPMNIKLDSLGSVGAWWHHCLCEQVLRGEHSVPRAESLAKESGATESRDMWEWPRLTTAVHAQYKEWCGTNRAVHDSRFCLSCMRSP
jgi:hypothetical protein